MGCGIFLMALAALFVVGAVLALLPVLSSVDAKAALKERAGTVAFCALLAAGLSLYGRSMFRRARHDAVVTTRPDEIPEQGDHRGLAWAVLVFGSLLVMGAAVAAWFRIAAGRLPAANVVSIPALLAMPIGAGRYLYRRRTPR